MHPKQSIRKIALFAILLTLMLSGVGGGSLGASTVPAARAEALGASEESRLSPRLLREMEGADTERTVPVIVTTAGPVDESEFDRAGGSIGRRFRSLNAFAATVPVKSLKHLAGAFGVHRISYDLEVYALNDVNFVTVGADIAERNYGLTGEGITVAVLDSGIAPHPDLGDRLLTEVEIVGHEDGFADPFGHGTHVAGIIAGDGSVSQQVDSHRRLSGIAPRARLISVRVLGPNGTGRVSDGLAGIEWVIAHKDLYEIRVLNISMGHPVFESYRTDPLCQAVRRAWEAGILVVVSAGNLGSLGYGTINSPGNEPHVLTVGASDHASTASRNDDFLTDFSSRGPSPLDHVVKPDLVAPGRGTVSLRAEGSTLDRTYPGLRVKMGAYAADPSLAEADSPYFRMSGTSMATPVVTGLAALMLEAEPSLTPDDLKVRLMKSAEKYPYYDLFAVGAGFADVLGALEVTDTAAAPALSPTVFLTGNGLRVRGNGSLVGDEEIWPHSVVWGGNREAGGGAKKLSDDSVVWGGNRTGTVLLDGGVATDSVVWGGNLILGPCVPATADSVVWGGNRNASGQGRVSGDSVVWGGNSVVWGGNQVLLGCAPAAGDSVVWGGN